MERQGPEVHPRAGQHSPDYRTVAVFWSVAEAELARALLESDGIPAAFLDGADAALLPGASPVRLLVPAGDLDRSRLLLGGLGDQRATGPALAAGSARAGVLSRVAAATGSPPTLARREADAWVTLALLALGLGGLLALAVALGLAL